MLMTDLSCEGEVSHPPQGHWQPAHAPPNVPSGPALEDDAPRTPASSSPLLLPRIERNSRTRADSLQSRSNTPRFPINTYSTLAHCDSRANHFSQCRRGIRNQGCAGRECLCSWKTTPLPERISTGRFSIASRLLRALVKQTNDRLNERRYTLRLWQKFIGSGLERCCLNGIS